MTMALFADFMKDWTQYFESFVGFFELLLSVSFSVALAWPTLPSFAMIQFTWAFTGVAVQQGLSLFMDVYPHFSGLGSGFIKQVLLNKAIKSESKAKKKEEGESEESEEKKAAEKDDDDDGSESDDGSSESDDYEVCNHTHPTTRARTHTRARRRSQPHTCVQLVRTR